VRDDRRTNRNVGGRSQHLTSFLRRFRRCGVGALAAGGQWGSSGTGNDGAEDGSSG
jgi:hypothetical protein